MLLMYSGLLCRSAGGMSLTPSALRLPLFSRSVASIGLWKPLTCGVPFGSDMLTRYWVDERPCGWPEAVRGGMSELTERHSARKTIHLLLDTSAGSRV